MARKKSKANEAFEKNGLNNPYRAAQAFWQGKESEINESFENRYIIWIFVCYCLNAEELTANKISVIEKIAYKNNAFTIVLHEIHCTTADKLVIPNFSPTGSVLSRKHGLATFVHKRLEQSLVDQSPLQSETEWLCVDVAGYKIIKTSTKLHCRESHQRPSRRFHTSVCMLATSTANMSTGTRSVTSLGHQVGQRVFFERPKFLNNVQ